MKLFYLLTLEENAALVLGVFAYVCHINSFNCLVFDEMGISYLDHLIKCVFVGNE